MNDLVVSALLWLGSLLMLVSAMGVVRFPDLFTRMHAATKTGTVGIIMLVSAVAVHFKKLEITIFAVLIVAFFFLTAPIAGQLIGRAAYRIGVPLWERTACDEFGQRPGKE